MKTANDLVAEIKLAVEEYNEMSTSNAAGFARVFEDPEELLGDDAQRMVTLEIPFGELQATAFGLESVTTHFLNGFNRIILKEDMSDDVDHLSITLAIIRALTTLTLTFIQYAEEYRFAPDYVSPPIETLRECLVELEISVPDFLVEAGIEVDDYNAIAAGKVGAINKDVAQRIVNVLGGSTAFWLNRQAQYDEEVNKHYANSEDNSRS